MAWIVWLDNGKKNLDSRYNQDKKDQLERQNQKYQSQKWQMFKQFKSDLETIFKEIVDGLDPKYVAIHDENEVMSFCIGDACMNVVYRDWHNKQEVKFEAFTSGSYTIEHIYLPIQHASLIGDGKNHSWLCWDDNGRAKWHKLGRKEIEQIFKALLIQYV